MPEHDGRKRRGDELQHDGSEESLTYQWLTAACPMKKETPLVVAQILGTQLLSQQRHRLVRVATRLTPDECPVALHLFAGGELADPAGLLAHAVSDAGLYPYLTELRLVDNVT